MTTRKPKYCTMDAGDAFLPDLVRRDLAGPNDADADALAEEFLLSITSADDAFENARDELVVEELGGPFVDDPELDWTRGNTSFS